MDGPGGAGGVDQMVFGTSCTGSNGLMFAGVTGKADTHISCATVRS